MTVRTGRQYTEGLSDGREVWLNGKRIADVTEHPAFIGGIRAIADFYNLQSSPEHQDAVTYVEPDTGERTGMAFLVPHSSEDLVRRGQAFKAWSDLSGGLMGRTPDFLNSVLVGFYASREYFGETDARFAENIRNYYRYCRDNDVALTHALTHPQIDRSKGPSEQTDPYLFLGVVRETSEGIVVRGARLLATLAPIADEVLVYPFDPVMPGDDRYAIAFAVPMDTPGLTIVCREAHRMDRASGDHPLSEQFDEMDAILLFDDVLVPWDRVFMKGSPEHANRLRSATGFSTFAGHQAVVKRVSKFELFVGLATLIAENKGTTGDLLTQERIGRLINYLELIKSLVIAAELSPDVIPDGVHRPRSQSIITALSLFPKIYPEMVEIMQLIATSGLIGTPSVEDFSSGIGDKVRHYFRGAGGHDAEDKVRVLKMAWELVGDAFGTRQELYERFTAGDPTRLLAGRFKSYDKQQAVRLARSLMVVDSLTGSTSGSKRHEGGFPL